MASAAARHDERWVDEAPGDAEVVRRVLAGERELFEVLMRRYDQRLYRVIHAVLRDQADVKDAMQQAWLQAWRKLRQLADPAAFAGWASRIAANEALGRVRGRVPLEPWPEDDMAPRAQRDPESDAAARELVRLVEAAAERLPAAQRAAFLLRDVEGLSPDEAAALLGVAPDVLKVRLHRARVSLRAEVGRAVDVAPEAYRFLADRCDPMVAWVMARVLTGPGPE